MKPTRVISRRNHSALARHTNCAPFGCVGDLILRIEQSFRPEYECMVVERCSACGRRVMAWGVLSEPAPVNNDADDDGA